MLNKKKSYHNEWVKHTKQKKLISELIKGEDSGFVENFDKKKFLEYLQQKYSQYKHKSKV